ncbi:MAG: glycosyltransferase [Desulfovibrio sp.]|nr:glycosyltransferase [Desulfovibrio sp.]
MIVLIAGLMFLQCALLFLLWNAGKRLAILADSERHELAGLPADYLWPKAALIVPVAGTHPRMHDALESLLRQDYPDFVPIFVTATEDEPAAALVGEFSEQHPALRHVIAGEAALCGQKNHNLLCGIAEANAAGAACYAFCDSTHLAAPGHLRSLLFPLADGRAVFTTGYHMVNPQDDGIVTLGYCMSVLIMRLLQSISAFIQPWGGSMAVSREAYERLDISSLWGRTVVDDCALVPFLQRKGIRVHLAASALLTTYAENHRLSVWRSWMARQLLYPKFCVPLQWGLLGGLLVVMQIPQAYSLVVVALSLLGINVQPQELIPALVWLFASFLLVDGQRACLARSVSALRWFLSFLLACGMFAFVHASTLFTKKIFWHGWAYTVGTGGTVLDKRPAAPRS